MHKPNITKPTITELQLSDPIQPRQVCFRLEQKMPVEILPQIA